MADGVGIEVRNKNGKLSITTFLANSCAASGICSLSNLKNAQEAFMAFCKQEIGDPKGRFRTTNNFPTLASFYLFAAGPEEKGFCWSAAHWLTYGTDFAAYLKKNKLGPVVTLGKKKNLKHHPEGTCQVWLWSPDQKAVEALWIKLNNEAKEAKDEKVEVE